MTQKKDRPGNPKRPYYTPDNLSKSNDFNKDLHHTAQQFGRSMATLYSTNVGSLDAFYRLLKTVETTFSPELRLIFLNSFFDEVEGNLEGGADGEI